MSNRGPGQQQSENTGGLLRISPREWDVAEQFFKAHPTESKMKKSDNSVHSFIQVEGEVYAVANRKYTGEEKHGQLGEGAYGKVKVVQTRAGDNFALKVEGRGLRADDDTELNIMKIIGFVQGQAARQLEQGKKFKNKFTKEKLYTVMKLKEGDELFKQLYVTFSDNSFERIRGKEALDRIQRVEIALKACQAIQNLHDNRIIHGDVKPENFMSKINGSNPIVVEAIDFGISLQLPDNQNVVTRLGRGSPLYMAPEVHGPYAEFSFASDVYALGIMLQEDLQLSDQMCAGMLEEEPSQRVALPEVIDRLNAELLKQKQELDKDKKSTFGISNLFKKTPSPKPEPFLPNKPKEKSDDISNVRDFAQIKEDLELFKMKLENYKEMTEASSKKQQANMFGSAMVFLGKINKNEKALLADKLIGEVDKLLNEKNVSPNDFYQKANQLCDTGIQENMKLHQGKWSVVRESQLFYMCNEMKNKISQNDNTKKIERKM